MNDRRETDFRPGPRLPPAGGPAGTIKATTITLPPVSPGAFSASMQQSIATISNPARLAKAVLLLAVWFVPATNPAIAATYEEGKQAYLGKDYARALAILKPLAENGDSRAQIMLGLMYDYGHGVPETPAESLKWYRMAAEQGAPLAQHDVGVKYSLGKGVRQNYPEAARWWQKAAAAGVPDSQFNLGLMYYRGTGLERDYNRAAEWFEQAATQGHARAQYSIAVMYALGQSKAKDYASALQWFRLAAEQDVAQAQFNLGVFHENGYAVAPDPERARAWYQLAADQGLPEAIEKLKTLKPETVADRPAPEPIEPRAARAETDDARPAAPAAGIDLNGWLARQAPGHYTLQLASLADRAGALKYINTQKLGPGAGYVAVIVKGKPRHNVIYGLYDTYQKAELAAGLLPASAPKPWIRNIGRLQRLLSP